jgi:hypothetical protein
LTFDTYKGIFGGLKKKEKRPYFAIFKKKEKKRRQKSPDFFTKSSNKVAKIIKRVLKIKNKK